MGNRPKMRGTIRIKDGEKYVTVGKVALWAGEGKGAKSPVMTGTVDVDGKKYMISLWDNASAGSADSAS